jgi:hypothetical protein
MQVQLLPVPLLPLQAQVQVRVLALLLQRVLLLVPGQRVLPLYSKKIGNTQKDIVIIVCRSRVLVPLLVHAVC